MIPGFDNEYCSNVSIFDMKDAFINGLKKIGWDNPVIEIFDNIPDKCLEIFIAKNKKMNKEFNKIAYSLNQNEEGCFMLIGISKEKMSGKGCMNGYIVEDNDTKPRSPFEVKMYFSNIWIYNLVLPAPIEESEFCKNIYKLLIDTLLNF